MKLAKTIVTISFSTFSFLGYSQEIEPTKLDSVKPTIININVDPNINTLLETKLKDITSDSYKIQLYYGNLDEAHSTLSKFKNKFNQWDGKIEFETPNYKVWVGNYKTRIEADRALLKINKSFPHAFIFKVD